MSNTVRPLDAAKKLTAERGGSGSAPRCPRHLASCSGNVPGNEAALKTPPSHLVCRHYGYGRTNNKSRRGRARSN